MIQSLDRRIFHGDIAPSDFADALIAEFRRGNWVAQQFGNDSQTVVQIASRNEPTSGGQTALTVTLRKVEDGVAVQIGRQAWLGVAASLGQTVLETLQNPWRLLGRLDDLAQDVENIQLTEKIWSVLETTARLYKATFTLSERLRRLVCAYCEVANPIGEPNCIACGAPLGRIQPKTCPRCGFVLQANETACPNCQKQY